MKLKTLLLEIARDLNDAEPGHEHVTWEVEALTTWFNEALGNAFTLNPTKFAEVKVIKLTTGSDQWPCDCAILHRVLGQTDALGYTTRSLSQSDGDLDARWTKPSSCPPARGPFRLTDFTFNVGEDGYFTVRPPVPPNADVYMKVLCYVRPKVFSPGDDIPDDGTVAAAKQWVLYRALMRDDESQVSLAAAQVHIKTFFELLKIQYTQELALQLGATTKARK